MGLILAVDGGGSKTHAVVVDHDGVRLGEGLAGGANHQSVGIDVAIRNIVEAVNHAIRAAGIHARDIGYAQYGLAGADRPIDFQVLRPALGSLPFANFDVVCDALQGLRTGSPEGIGVVLVCGAGTNAMGRNACGKIAQVGGFGYLYGDAAGGAFLAEETFRAAIRSWEKRERESLLPEMVAASLGFSSIQSMYDDYLDHNVQTVPLHLCEVLHHASRRGDPLSMALLTRCGQELGRAATAVAQRLGHSQEDSFPVVLTGSILQKGRDPHLLQALRDSVVAVHPHARVTMTSMAPVYGSVLLARDSMGLPTSEAIMERFASYGGGRL